MLDKKINLWQLFAKERVPPINMQIEMSKKKMSARPENRRHFSYLLSENNYSSKCIRTRIYRLKYKEYEFLTCKLNSSQFELVLNNLFIFCKRICNLKHCNFKL